MDEVREEGGPTSKTTLSGEHGRRSKAKSPEKQERADSPGPSCASMKSGWSMDHPRVLFQDGNQFIEKRHQERSKVTSAQSVQQHQTELEMNQEELADTLGGGFVLALYPDPASPGCFDRLVALWSPAPGRRSSWVKEDQKVWRPEAARGEKMSTPPPWSLGTTQQHTFSQKSLVSGTSTLRSDRLTLRRSKVKSLAEMKRLQEEDCVEWRSIVRSSFRLLELLWELTGTETGMRWCEPDSWPRGGRSSGEEERRGVLQ
ncbi:unnamed protein product [Gadus morhua 'NCC']